MADFRSRGHSVALAAVRRAIERDRPPHALLLVGSKGVGKTTLAMDLAAGLLCQDPDPARRPCRACAACHKVDHGNHADLHLVAPEGAGDQIRLTQVQQLIADLSLIPMEGRWRVAIVTSAHRLNPDAQNALLKTLEEPVGAACIVLAADDVAALLPTVVSRAERLRLGPVDSGVIAALLGERGLADPVRAASLARVADGRPGLAIALAGDPETMLTWDRLARSLLDLTDADARTRLAAVSGLLADGTLLDAALRAEPTPEPTEAPAAPRRGRPPAKATAGAAASAGGSRKPAPAERRRAAVRVLTVWREVGRDLAVVAGGADGSIRHRDLLEQYRELATRVDHRALLDFLERLDGVIDAIEAYANAELALDVMVLAWPHGLRAA